MLLGVHISGATRISETFALAHNLGCNTMQIFARSPQRWRQKPLEAEEIEAFARNKEKFNIRPVFIHIPYLLNLASPNPKLYKASTLAYIEDMLEAAALHADYIVTHMGSHVQTTEVGGLKRLARALNRVIEKTKDSKVAILLENTAGSGSWLGYKFSHQRRVLERVKEKDRVGLCLDTAHAYAAGYDLAAEEGLSKLLSDIDQQVGLAKLKLVHLNDTAQAMGSHRDVHEHIGKGNIGKEGFWRILNHPSLKEAAFNFRNSQRQRNG
jgi:deoxyribonuclease IV